MFPRIASPKKPTVGGGFNYFLFFTPIPGEMIQLDEQIFQMGWLKHVETTN